MSTIDKEIFKNIALGNCFNSNKDLGIQRDDDTPIFNDIESRYIPGQSFSVQIYKYLSDNKDGFVLCILIDGNIEPNLTFCFRKKSRVSKPKFKAVLEYFEYNQDINELFDNISNNKDIGLIAFNFTEDSLDKNYVFLNYDELIHEPKIHVSVPEIRPVVPKVTFQINEEKSTPKSSVPEIKFESVLKQTNFKKVYFENRVWNRYKLEEEKTNYQPFFEAYNNLNENLRKIIFELAQIIEDETDPQYDLFKCYVSQYIIKTVDRSHHGNLLKFDYHKFRFFILDSNNAIPDYAKDLMVLKQIKKRIKK